MTDSCSIEAAGLISIEQALEKIKQLVLPIDDNERVVLKKALGRVLAKPVTSPINIPPERNSAMDGYAFSSSDIDKNQTFTLILAGTSWAGRPYDKAITSGECVRIYTGAIVPKGADSVIMQEHISKNGKHIFFPAKTITNQYIRDAGSDIAIQTELISAQKKITAIDIGLIGSAGIYDVVVKRKINIAFFSTGDELCSIGQELLPGQVYDSNRYSLNALLSDNNCHINDMGVVVDDKQCLEKTLLSAAKAHDVIITTGGASVGDADYIQEVLSNCGHVGFWKIAIKPGKPLAFGKIKNSYFFGLPGNPVSVITTFHKIVIPALQYLSGASAKKTIQIKAICTTNLKKEKGRQEYQRGILSQHDSGEFHVKSAGKQGSNNMSALSNANCYIVLPVHSKGVCSGQEVIVEPFDTYI